MDTLTRLPVVSAGADTVGLPITGEYPTIASDELPSLGAIRTGIPLGAEVEHDGVRFTVWAPVVQKVVVVIESPVPGEHALDRGPDGYWTGFVDGIKAGAKYRFRLDGDGPFPDPCSRFQPDGPHGPSLVVDPGAFAWTDGDWRGIELRGQVLYELHVGTFTPEGTFEALARELPRLARPGRHGHRGDAGGGVPRRAQLGLRRSQSVRAVSRLRGRAMRCGVSSTRRMRQAWPSFSTWCTTTSAPTATISHDSARPTLRIAIRTTGAPR